MTNLNEKKARLESLRNSIAFVSLQISDYQNAVVRTKLHVYAGFTYDPDTGSIYFLRDGIKFRYLPAVGRYKVKLVDTGAYDAAPVVHRLPADVISVLDKLPSACRRLDAETAALDQLDAEIAAEEKAAAPVEELEEYDVCAAIHTKTLAQRVRERCQMEAGELPPFTPETMPDCDRDLIEDINDALDEIDASGVNELLKYADDSENEGRKAKAAGYRAAANLAALYAINDAIEEQPELEELMSELFDWDKPAQLPANITAGTSESFAAARRVFGISDLAPDDLSERSRLWAADTWAIAVDYFRGMDDDLVKAFAIHAGAGLWIQYFKQTWMFINDGVVDASCGSFEEQATSFVAILSRYLAPDVEDLY